MSATQTQTVLVPHPSHDPVVEGVLPITIIENASASSDDEKSISKSTGRVQRFSVVFIICGITFCGSVANGLVTVGLPAIAKDLHLPQSLSFWPASVSSLTTASTLLLAGSVADVLGPRWVDLVGCLGIAAFMIGAGFSQTGTELVVMRAMQGVALSLHLASSIAIITRTLPQGRGRNMAFSFLGVSQPLGFSLGLVLGGLLADSVGWRVGWYMNGGFAAVLTILGFWALPNSHEDRGMKEIVHDLKTKVDWVGALLASGFMAMLCYLLAIISTDVHQIKEPVSIVLLCLVALALPSFAVWVHHQVKKERPALIPNKLWRNPTFSTVCIIIALSFSVINSLELFASLFFQEIQHLSAIQASLRILPSLVVGALLQLCLGFFVHRLPPFWIVTVTSILCAGSPLLMAVIQPSWTYWANAFVAQLLQPISCDALFTVGLIVITDTFPEDTQALAGAVFNTAAQFGTALGLAITQVVSTQVTEAHSGREETHALMEGYRASFWTMFGLMILCGVIGGIGLRKTGRVGLKRD